MLSKSEFQPKLIYSPEYNINFFGVEKLHPFDSCKYGRSWNKLFAIYGKQLQSLHILPSRSISHHELSTVHTKSYLELLSSSRYLAQALEMPPLALCPSRLIDKHILNPMRLATMGTLIAAKSAIKNGIGINLSGGYHHASEANGEGFCIYSDIGIAIASLRMEGTIQETDKVVIIDLDAHQGNGLERIFLNDQNVKIFDVYNAEIYPNDGWAKRGIDLDIPLKSGTSDRKYIELLQEYLPSYLDSITPIRLAFYNAGTDIYCKDPLGKLDISAQGVLSRDILVFKTLLELKIPFVMVLSGGYTKDSYLLIANSIRYLIDNTAGIPAP
ncbi:deacylase [Limnothrix sp. PR1529]|uniref:histone deacetylase family protein n=1 Tax=Limnothrix sp. PR1529 TaxID=1704291 RepID=UPI00081E3225|nr:histone deacetylase [Limnothrix sp. PR1529]OCQ96616.1 deacylase [Limnothrix sp. P13C2]PIB09758.1 deacylase [Limnothrix sp. PR1529]